MCAFCCFCCLFLFTLFFCVVFTVIDELRCFLCASLHRCCASFAFIIYFGFASVVVSVASWIYLLHSGYHQSSVLDIFNPSIPIHEDHFDLFRSIPFHKFQVEFSFTLSDFFFSHANFFIMEIQWYEGNTIATISAMANTCLCVSTVMVHTEDAIVTTRVSELMMFL